MGCFRASYTRRMTSLAPALRRAALLALACAAMPAASAPPGPEFSRCVDQLRQELPQHPKVRPETFELHTRQAQDLRTPIDTATQSQPEFQLPIWDYLARLVDPLRVDDGRGIVAREAAALAQLAATYRIDPATVVAIFGIESDFGRLKGRYPVVDATLGRACLGLSNRERKAHFFAALWLLQEGQVRAEEFRGSWAGAFGMTQFMPGTYVRYQADGDGDGRIDTYHSVADALATTANYLKSLGWVEDLPWGIEVQAPRDLARAWSSAEREHACLASQEPGGRCRRLDQWAALGVVRADGQPLTTVQRLWAGALPTLGWALLTPAGANGPAWLVSRNFQVIWNYNRADSYALAIGLLSSALRQEPGVRAAWPTAEAQWALSRAGISALQQLLVAAGQCGLDIDGYDGPMTRQAIRAEERRRGLPETGRPTSPLLEKMRAEPYTAPGACAADAPRALQRPAPPAALSPPTAEPPVPATPAALPPSAPASAP